MTMRAAVVTRPGMLELREVAVPKPGPYQALVRIEACAICNATDLKILRGRLPFVPLSQYPGILGHEAVGTVVETGRSAPAFPAGARVLRPWAMIPGLGSFWGGFADYGLVTDAAAAEADGRQPPQPLHRGMQVVPPNIEPALATQLVTWKECMSYLVGLQAAAARSILVMGTGPVGLAACALARSAFSIPVVVCLGRRQAGLDRARRLGATHTVTTLEGQVSDSLNATAPCGFDLVLDAAGDADLIRLALAVLKPTGRLGAYASEDSGKPSWNALLTDLRARSGACDESTAHERLLELVRSAAIELGALISHRLPFERIEEGLALVESRAALKVVVEMPG